MWKLKTAQEFRNIFPPASIFFKKQTFFIKLTVSFFSKRIGIKKSESKAK